MIAQVIGRDRDTVYLTAEDILKYLMGDEKLHTLITARNNEINLITSDQSLYEAVGSVENRKAIDMNLLVKLLEATKIFYFCQITGIRERKVLTPERVEELRNKVVNAKNQEKTSLGKRD